MTLDDLDQLLAQWKSRAHTAAECLVEVRSLPAYEILTGGAGAHKLQLTGITGQRFAPAVAALEQVWLDYGVLSTTVQRAIELRQTVPRFAPSQKIREIVALLTEAVIPLPHQVTLADRDLLNAASAGASVTLQQLLDVMNSGFVAGRDGLLEIDANWKRLDAKLGPAVAFLNTHRGETAAGIPELRQMVETLRPRALGDPLGANTDFDRQIAPALAQSRAEIDKLIERRKNLRDNIAYARKLLQRLGALREESELLSAECAQKISGRRGPAAVPRERVASLANRLAGIETAGGTIDAVCEEVEVCTGTIATFVAAEEHAIAQNRAPLELRRELRGRLSALKAKAVGRGVSEDPMLVEFAQRADALLHARPTPIDEAAGLLGQYESRLNGRDGQAPLKRSS